MNVSCYFMFCCNRNEWVQFECSDLIMGRLDTLTLFGNKNSFPA